MLGGLTLAAAAVAEQARLLLIHHTRCRFGCCAPDWIEQIMFKLPRPRCGNCRRIL